MFANFILIIQLIVFPLNLLIPDYNSAISINIPGNNFPGIVWDDARKLTWNDFQSEVDINEPLHAMTSTNIDVKAQCYGNQMKFEVKCVFVTKDSWSKNKSSKRLLDHEQMHFDLTEVHARLLRKQLSKSGDVCENLKKSALDKIVNKYFTDWKTEQDLYDAETGHGLNEQNQQIWADLISKRLQDLQPFAHRK